jgi:hypothetical protein
MTKGNAIKYYRQYSAAEQYIVGFLYKKMLYAIQVEELMPRWLEMKAESHGHAEKLQMNLKQKHKEELIKKGATPICTEHEFLEMNTIHNKGFTFEKLIFTLNGQGDTWQRDNVGFEVQGDINIDGMEIQIKFQNAQIVAVPTLHRLQKETKWRKMIEKW